MTFKELFVQLLTEDQVISQYVGKRVYDCYMPELTPDQLYPCLTYKIVSRQHLKTLAGNGGTFYPRIEVTAWSLRSADLAAIIKRFFLLEGPLSLTSQDGTVKLRWLWVEDGADEAEAPSQADEQAVRSSSVDLVVWFDSIGG
jgi:hypothetical protein